MELETHLKVFGNLAIDLKKIEKKNGIPAVGHALPERPLRASAVAYRALPLVHRLRVIPARAARPRWSAAAAAVCCPPSAARRAPIC